jgi:hypothetical protein
MDTRIIVSGILNLLTRNNICDVTVAYDTARFITKN